MAELRWRVGVLVVATALGLAACGGATGPGGRPSGSVRLGSLVLTVPNGFMRHDVRRHEALVGSLVTDYRVKPGSPTLRAAIFPADAVALSLGRRKAPASLPLPPLRLPLNLGELQGPQHHADGTAWNGAFGYHGWLYAISFWTGQRATQRDRTALQHALVTIRAAR